MSKDLTTVPSHIAKFVESLELKPVDQLAQMKPEQRIDAASFGLKLELAGKLYTGFALMGLKEQMGHGKYMASLAAKGISARSASYCTNLVALAIRIPSSNWRTFADLEPSKLDLMTSWSDNELKTFGKGEEVRGLTIDDAKDMSVRDVKAQLKEAQASNNELEQEIEKKSLALAKADEQIRLYKKKQNSLEGFNYPLSIERVRVESSVLSAQAVQFIDDMEQLAVELTQASDLSKENKKQEAQFSAGASSLYLNLKAIHSKAAYLMKSFAGTIGEDYLPDKPEDVPSMTFEEAEKIHSLHQLLLAEARLGRDSRESQRKTKRKKAKK